MSFEIASVTTCGQSLLARATAINRVRFVDGRLETTSRTANAIGSATALPSLSNPVTGEIYSVTYTLNQTRVTVRFNNLPTTRDFHTLWLLAKLDNEDDSAAVPLCAVVSQEPVYIPTTLQSDTHIDIHLNLSFVRADGTVSITEGPAFTISDHEQFRIEVREEFDDVEADIAELQDTYVTKDTAQTISGQKTFSTAVQMNSSLNVTGTTTLGTTTTGTLTTETISSYAHTPRTNVSYDLGSTSYRWNYVYGRYGNFSGSVSTAGTLSVTGASTLTGNTTVGGTLGVTGATTIAGLTSEAISSYAHTPRTASTSSSTGYDLGASNNRWKYVYAQYGNFNSSISTAGTLSVTGASTLMGNTSVGGTLGVTGATTLGTTTTGTLTAEAISSYTHTPRTASTSSSTGYDLGASDNRWKYVYARYGNFSYSVTVADGISVGGSITRPSGSTATQDIGTHALPFANVYASSFHGNLDGNALTADEAAWATEAGSCTGNASTATKLSTSRTIDGMSFNGTASITHYGTCSTTAVTVNKTVSLSGFNLVTGSRIAVKFSYSNTAANPTLNVNSTGARAICYRGSNAVSDSSYYRWQAGDIVEFIYDGTNWVIVGWQTYAYYSNSATSASSATSATYATNLRYSSTSVLSATGTSTVTSVATIRPETSGAVSLGTSSYKWDNVYANTGNFSDVVITGGLYFSSNKTVKMNLYNSGIDITGHLTPASSSTYNLGSNSYQWQRLFVNYISGTGVAKSIAGYGTGTVQDSNHPIGSLIFVQITTATNPSGVQLSNSTMASPTFFGDVPASKIRPISLFASGNNGNTTCHQHSSTTLSGTWRVLGYVWSSNVSSYPPVVLAVRIA